MFRERCSKNPISPQRVIAWLAEVIRRNVYCVDQLFARLGIMKLRIVVVVRRLIRPVFPSVSSVLPWEILPLSENKDFASRPPSGRNDHAPRRHVDVRGLSSPGREAQIEDPSSAVITAR